MPRRRFSASGLPIIYIYIYAAARAAKCAAILRGKINCAGAGEFCILCGPGATTMQTPGEICGRRKWEGKAAFCGGIGVSEVSTIVFPELSEENVLDVGD